MHYLSLYQLVVSNSFQFSPDIVNHLSDRLESTETTPERQTILDAHIRSRIRNELEHLKKDEEDVRREIESALEKENLDHERAMAGEASEADGSSVGDVRSSAALLGDLEDIKVKIEKHQARKEDAAFQEVQTFAQAVTDCYRYAQHSSRVSMAHLRIGTTPQHL